VAVLVLVLVLVLVVYQVVSLVAQALVLVGEAPAVGRTRGRR
jgi:di/tricarboxylate transporter